MIHHDSSAGGEKEKIKMCVSMWGRDREKQSCGEKREKRKEEERG